MLAKRWMSPERSSEVSSTSRAGGIARSLHDLLAEHRAVHVGHVVVEHDDVERRTAGRHAAGCSASAAGRGDARRQ